MLDKNFQPMSFVILNINQIDQNVWKQDFFKLSHDLSLLNTVQSVIRLWYMARHFSIYYEKKISYILYQISYIGYEISNI